MRRITKYSLLLSLVLGLYFPTVFAQSNMTNEMFDLAKLKSGVKNKRISSTDPTGGNRDHLEPFKPGEKRIIADIKGAGAINHIWVSFGNALFLYIHRLILYPGFCHYSGKTMPLYW